jgi:hypothetical protein
MIEPGDLLVYRSISGGADTPDETGQHHIRWLHRGDKLLVLSTYKVESEDGVQWMCQILLDDESHFITAPMLELKRIFHLIAKCSVTE